MDAFRPGATVGKYQLLRRLGKGGAGEVWEAALSLQSIVTPAGARAKLQGSVALKFLRLDDPMGSAEILTLNLLGNVRHPNLVEYRDAFLHGDYCFIAMTMCDGTLFDRAEKCRQTGVPGIPREELLEYFHDAARAIDYLHSRERNEAGREGGIVHGDIKPQNLLLSGGSVRVADFGLAKLAGVARRETEAFGYSLHYVAPEAANGKGSKFSDQYSLAATYYHLRTGHTIYKGATKQDILIQVAAAEAAPADRIAHPHEREVLRRALDKNEDRRWGSCVEFVRKLAEAARYEPPTTKSGLDSGTDPMGPGGESEWETPTRILPDMPELKDLPSFIPDKDRKKRGGGVWKLAGLLVVGLAVGVAGVIWAFGPFFVADQQTEKGLSTGTVFLSIIPGSSEVTAQGSGAFVEHPDGQLAVTSHGGVTTITIKGPPGYEDLSQKVFLKPNTSSSLTLQLTPKDAVATATVAPAEAKVTAANGVVEGSGSQRRIRVPKPNPKTKVAIHAESSGYQSMDFELEVGPGQEKATSIRLLPLAAEWSLDVDPPEALAASLPASAKLSPATGAKRTLKIDGQTQSPGAEIALSFAAKGYSSHREAFRFSPGERGSRSIRLKREPVSQAAVIGLKLVRIPAGSFLRGEGDEVKITREFLVGDAEVTQGQFAQVMGGPPAGTPEEASLPVANVDWYTAVKFCNRLSESEHLPPFYRQLRPADPDSVVETDGVGYRLPTEAEWEFACRSGSRAKWSFGDAVAKLEQFSWYRENSEGKRHPVRNREPNALGLYDMHGNVREWCWDLFDPDYYSKPESKVDPRGPKRGVDRVVRGGCFESGPNATTCGHRISQSPDSKSQAIGFRVARNAK